MNKKIILLLISVLIISCNAPTKSEEKPKECFGDYIYEVDPHTGEIIFTPSEGYCDQ